MTPIEQLLSTVDFKPVEDARDGVDGLPYATHSGELDLFGYRVRCYRLNDGRAILHADDLLGFFEISAQ